MMGFGALTTGASSRLAPRIAKASGILVITLGIIMFNRGLVMTGSGWDFNTVKNRLLATTPATQNMEQMPEHQHGVDRNALPDWAKKLNDDIAAWLETWRGSGHHPQQHTP